MKNDAMPYAKKDGKRKTAVTRGRIDTAFNPIASSADWRTYRPALPNIRGVFIIILIACKGWSSTRASPFSWLRWPRRAVIGVEGSAAAGLAYTNVPMDE